MFKKLRVRTFQTFDPDNLESTINAFIRANESITYVDLKYSTHETITIDDADKGTRKVVYSAVLIYKV